MKTAKAHYLLPVTRNKLSNTLLVTSLDTRCRTYNELRTCDGKLHLTVMASQLTWWRVMSHLWWWVSSPVMISYITPVMTNYISPVMMS